MSGVAEASAAGVFGPEKVVKVVVDDEEEE